MWDAVEVEGEPRPGVLGWPLRSSVLDGDGLHAGECFQNQAFELGLVRPALVLKRPQVRGGVDEDRSGRGQTLVDLSEVEAERQLVESEPVHDRDGREHLLVVLGEAADTILALGAEGRDGRGAVCRRLEQQCGGMVTDQVDGRHFLEGRVDAEFLRRHEGLGEDERIFPAEVVPFQLVRRDGDPGCFTQGERLPDLQDRRLPQHHPQHFESG